MRGGHGVYFYDDDQNFPYAACECGWRSPPVPDVETAADFYGEHRAQAALDGVRADTTHGQ